MPEDASNHPGFVFTPSKSLCFYVLSHGAVLAVSDVEGLTLLKADNTTGYFGVALRSPGRPKPYHAQVRRGGKMVYLGCFATAEEAALCVARSPEGQAAAQKAAAATRPLASEEEGTGPFVKEEGVVPPMPPDAYVKVEIVVKEEASSGSRPKRRRMK